MGALGCITFVNYIRNDEYGRRKEGCVNLLGLSPYNRPITPWANFFVSSLEVGAVLAVLAGSKDRVSGQLWQLTIGRKAVGFLRYVLSH